MEEHEAELAVEVVVQFGLLFDAEDPPEARDADDLEATDAEEDEESPPKTHKAANFRDKNAIGSSNVSPSALFMLFCPPVIRFSKKSPSLLLRMR